MTDDIKLPPLHYDELPEAGDAIPAMHGYAGKAIKYDRQQRGEPVVEGWKLVPETPTSKQIVHMACQIKGADADGWFRTDGDDWPEYVDAAERAYKWALSEAPQPAAPAQEPIVPEGWRVVPVEPTRKMESAAEDYWNSKRFAAFSSGPRTWEGLYATMLAAAPKFGEEE